MKKIRHIAVAGCSLLLLCQCASQDEIRELNYQIRAVNQKVDDVKSTTVNSMQKRQASSVSKIDQVEDEAVRIKSLIEENAHQASMFREQTKEDIANLQAAIESSRVENEQRIATMEQQLAQVTGNFERLQQSRIREAEKRAQTAAKRAEEARKKSIKATSAGTSSSVRVTPNAKKSRVSSGQLAPETSGQTAQKTTAPKKQVDSAPQSQEKASVKTTQTTDATSGPFDQAMKQYKSKQFTDAYASFEKVLSGNPRGAKAAETLFYMGECLYSQGEYDLAILDYQKVISNHSKDILTPNALLKQGMSFEKLTDHETAKIIYKKLIGDYGNSGAADQAKKRLTNL